MGISAWDDMEDELQRGQNNVFGESFQFIPMQARANKTAVLDNSRVSRVICGTFTRKPVSDNFNPSALSTKGLRFTDLAQRTPTLDVVADDVGAPVKQGDVFVRCGNGVEYVVTTPAASGHGILSIKLIEKGVSGNAP